MRKVMGVGFGLALIGVLALTVRGQLEMADRLASLDRQIEVVQTRLAEKPVRQIAPSVTLRAATTPAPEVARRDATKPGAMDRSHGDDGADAPSAEEPTVSIPAIERGYIYAGEWEDMEQELAAMSVEQQKQHWDQMFQAIESGALEVFDE